MLDINPGPERQCHACLEWWPSTTEFFVRDTRTEDGLHPVCRACAASTLEIEERAA